MSESLISDTQLKALWKQAIASSLYPDNDWPAHKIYYILLKKYIIESYRKSQTEHQNEQENLHDSKEGSCTHSSVGME
jgi:hypothetical protein